MKFRLHSPDRHNDLENLQVKSIDDDLYEALGRRAALENRSISQEVISILKAYLSTPGIQHQQANRQFLELCGTWAGEEPAEQMIKDIRKNRHRKSKHRSVEL